MSSAGASQEKCVLPDDDKSQVNQAAPPPLDDSLATGHATPPAGLWRAGTLTYTTGGLAVLFCWLLWGDFAWWMKERSVGPVVQLLLRKFGASDFVASLFLVFLPQGLGMLLGPIISYKSDRHRGRWGRRIPFLMIPTPIASLAMVGLAFAPKLGAWLHVMLAGRSPGLDQSILIMFGAFWILFEVATITANAVFGALVNDVVPRPTLGRFYGLFRAMNLLAGIVFTFWLFGKANDYYMPIFLSIAVLYGVGFTLMCLKVKEGAYP
jgi:MFS family permease